MHSTQNKISSYYNGSLRISLLSRTKEAINNHLRLMSDMQFDKSELMQREPLKIFCSTENHQSVTFRMKGYLGAMHSHSKYSERSKGSHNGSKRDDCLGEQAYDRTRFSFVQVGKDKKSFYDDDGDYEEPKPKFSASFAGYNCYTCTYESWDNSNFQSSTSGFEWRDDSKWEKAKKRVWSVSDVEDDYIDVGSCSHRVAHGLPPTGPLKLDDVKSAFRASALKWHPDKHQGPSQAIAGEKFKLCVDAYKSLCNSLKST